MFVSKINTTDFVCMYFPSCIVSNFVAQDGWTGLDQKGIIVTRQMVEGNLTMKGSLMTD